MPLSTTTALVIAATAIGVYVVSNQYKSHSTSAIHELSEAPPMYNRPSASHLTNQTPIKISPSHQLPFPFIPKSVTNEIVHLQPPTRYVSERRKRSHFGGVQ